MNTICLVGRIGQDPETHTFENGNKKTSFSIAVDDGYFSREKQEWIKQTIWLNIVLFKESKLLRGDLIEVTGKIQPRTYETKDGVKKTVTDIVASSARLLQRVKPDKSQPSTGDSTAEYMTPAEKPKPVGVPSDDLPFIVTVLLAVGSLINLF